MHVPVRLLVYYLQRQGEAANGRKTKVNQLITKIYCEDLFWLLSHSATVLSADQSDYLTLGGNHRFTDFTACSELEAKAIQVLGNK